MFFSDLKDLPAIKTLCLITFVLLMAASPDQSRANGSDEFPEFPNIKNNVEFWEKVYSTYSVNTAVIHDQNDLTKIYEIVTLVDQDMPDARRINTNRLNAVKERYTDILQRLASGHPPETMEEHRVAKMFQGPGAQQAMRFAAENIRAQNGQKERFLEGVARSSAYLARIRQILHEHGLPADLAYLPHVESSFNVEAYSKSGAAGIWQFTRSTGKQYMKIDRHTDERRDPIISTRAAAKLLKKNYEALGSWPLAITAYNYGTAGMVRASQSHGSYENIFRHYNEGYFKFASRNFYSEFLAARKVAKRLAANPHHADVADIAPLSHPGSSVDIRSTEAGGQTPLHTHISVSSISQSSPKGGRISTGASHVRRYTVKRGDTAYSIATANNITAEHLYRANNLHPKTPLRSGQSLIIPSPKTEQKTTLQSPPSGKKRSARLTGEKQGGNLLVSAR